MSDDETPPLTPAVRAMAAAARLPFDDQITDLCADIDGWDDQFADGDPAVLVVRAHELLGRARHLLKELLAEWPR